MLTVTVFAQESSTLTITVTAEKYSDKISVIGHTSSTVTDVNFRVESPSGNSVVAITQVSSDDDGNFKTKFGIGPTWSEDGFYKITASQVGHENLLYTLNVLVEVNNGMVSENTFVTESNLESKVIISSDPKDTRDRGLKINAELTSNTITINGLTDKVSKDITLIVTAPMGNTVSFSKVSSALNGEFTFVIEISQMWKQDGIYTVTAQQFDGSEYTASIEVDIKNSKVYTSGSDKKEITPRDNNSKSITEPIPEHDKQKVIELKKELRELKNENSKLHSEINKLKLKIDNLNHIVTEQVKTIMDMIKQFR